MKMAKKDVEQTKDMNRNEKFEWKKEIVKDMARTKAKVTDMAERLAMGEEEMYAFLSRNFGGVRKLRESLGLPRDIKRKQQYATVSEAVREPKLLKVVPNKDASIPEFMEAQKKKMIEDFKLSLSVDMGKVYEEVKAEILSGFKQDIISELRTF